MNTLMIHGVILAIVIAVGLIMALMVWKKKVGYRVFFTTGIIVVSASIVLMVISRLILYSTLFGGIPILVLGLIYLIMGSVGSGKWEKSWKRIIVVVIGVLVTLLAMCGAFMWGFSGQGALVALSSVFVFVGLALSIGALVWPPKRGRLK